MKINKRFGVEEKAKQQTSRKPEDAASWQQLVCWISGSHSGDLEK
jgi:hypothetical protein